MAVKDVMLADTFRAHADRKTSMAKPSLIKHVKSRLVGARRFVMDERAMEKVAHVSKTAPDLILREQQFARAPYDLMWVEFDFRSFYYAKNGRYPEGNDRKSGFLIDHDVVYTVSADDGDGLLIPSLMPLIHHLHESWEFQSQLDFCQKIGTSRMQLDSLLWGEIVHTLPQEDQRALRASHSCELNVDDWFLTGEKTKQDLLRSLVFEQAGDLHNLITLLLLLNRPSLTKYVRDVGFRKSFSRGKNVTFMSHTVVTIDLDPLPLLRKIGTQGDGTPKRRHEVRGHYCHNEAAKIGKRRGCIHVWSDDPKNPDGDHWQCSLCDGKRWWRHQHERGSAEIGFNTKNYEISA